MSQVSDAKALFQQQYPYESGERDYGRALEGGKGAWERLFDQGPCRTMLETHMGFGATRPEVRQIRGDGPSYLLNFRPKSERDSCGRWLVTREQGGLFCHAWSRYGWQVP